MTYYIKSGNTYSITDEANIDIRKELPVGTYMVSFSLQKGFYLTQVDNLEVNGKIYGNLETRCERIINSFSNRPNNTGVLLQGEKGSGKTLLAKRISETCRKHMNIATILVNQEFSGDGFNDFMQGIDQPTVVIFDEFEKNYSAGAQEQILTLLDGVFPSKKLFVLTVNDMRRVDSHLQNRPGRLFYSVQYSGLTSDFIEEFCRDRLDNQDYVQAIINLASLFKSFNFDMLQSLVEEMNRYKETPQEALDMLNIKPDTYDWSDTYIIRATVPGWGDEVYFPYGEEILSRSPINSTIGIEFWRSEKDYNEFHSEAARKRRAKDGEEGDYEDYPELVRDFVLENTSIAQMDGEGGFIYRYKDGMEVTLKKKAFKAFDYREHL